ncbi:MAG: aspartate kinase [Pseudomonadota bacterium]
MIVQKYGGTSVGSMARIEAVANKIAATRAQGQQLVVVVSAMAGETDRLDRMARHWSPTPHPREHDVVLSTGEQTSIGLLCLCLQSRGIAAKSFTGAQAGIFTDDIHTRAHIQAIDTQPLLAALEAGYVAVVAGFQGITQHGDISTLGRGGSDTTAVALAAALRAEECQIFTDVDGVYTADPNIVPEARRLSEISFEEMLELSSEGAKVLQYRAVEIAGHYQVPVRVLSTFAPGEGTSMHFRTERKNQVSGIAYSRTEACISLSGIPSHVSWLPLLKGCQAGQWETDLWSQTPAVAGVKSLSFLVHRRDLHPVAAWARTWMAQIGGQNCSIDDKVSKITLVGLGLRSKADIITNILETLASQGISVQSLTSSEIKVSLVVDEEYLEESVHALHAAFELQHADTHLCSD